MHLAESDIVATVVSKEMSTFQSQVDNIKQYLKHCPLEDPQYFLFDNHCYYISKNKTNYQTAIETCKEKLLDYGGGRLMEPRSTTKNELILRLAHESTGKKEWSWIGITDNATEGEFTYKTNGLPINFDPNWNSGYGSKGTGSNCILSHMNDESHSDFAKWADYDCSQNFSSICESLSPEVDIQKMATNTELEKMKIGLNEQLDAKATEADLQALKVS